MGSNSYALLLDGGFVAVRLSRALKRFPTADDIEAACERIKAHELLKDMRLLRAYFYNAPPFTETVTNPIDSSRIELGRDPNVARNTSLHDSLEMKPDFALRMGTTVCHGWKVNRSALRDLARTSRPLRAEDMQPHIEQKGVDLRIGLDIARLSLNRLVSTIVIVSGDSDLVPAFKFARREGIRVYLDTMRHGVRRELKAHADRILDAAYRAPPEASAPTSAP